MPAASEATAADVLELLDLGASVEAEAWLDGGRGVDALLEQAPRAPASEESVRETLLRPIRTDGRLCGAALPRVVDGREAG